MKYLLSMMSLFISMISFSQNQPKIDSLKALLETSLSDKEKVDVWNELASSYPTSDTTIIFSYLQKAISVAEEINYDRGLADSYLKNGRTYILNYQYQSAESNLSQSLKIAQENNYLEVQADNLHNLGVLHYYQGNNAKALSYYLQAIEINEKNKDKVRLADNCNGIGAIYHTQEENEKALEYFLKALEIREEVGDRQKILVSITNVGAILKEMNKHKESIEYLKQGIRLAEVLKNERYLALNYNNLGYSYESLNLDNQALEQLQKSLKLSQKLKFQSLTASSLNLMGKIYFKQKKYELAREYLQKAISLAQQINYSLSIQFGYEVLSQLEEAIGDYQAALKAYKSYKEISDSLLNEKKTKQIASLEIQYETEKKEQEITTLNQQTQIQELELNRYTLLMTILGISLIVLILGGLVAYLVIRQRQFNLQQQAQNMEQKMLRAQMNPHFIFNAMAAIQDFMLQNNSKQAALYLSKFSKLIRQILDNSRSDYIRLEQEVSMLENYLSLQNLRKQKPFTYQIEVAEDIDAEEVAIPPMFAQPFIENAIEHGLTNSVEKGEINIRFDLQKDYVLLSVQDNGVGIEKSTQIKKVNPEQHESLATKITEERIAIFRRSIKKDIAFEIQNLTQGTQVVFRLPYQFV